MKVVNLETIIDMQSLHRTWSLNESSRIRAKQKIHRKIKEACKSSWSRIGSLESFTLTIPWNLTKSVKIFPGIIVRRLHTDQKQMIRRVKEDTSAVLFLSGLDENYWEDSMEYYIYLRNVQELLSDGKIPYERRFGTTFKESIIPFDSLFEYYPISAKDQSRIHQFGKKIFSGLFHGCALFAGEFWKDNILIADIEELETMDVSEIYSKRLNAKEAIFPKENGNFTFSSRSWTNRTFWKRSDPENIHIETGTSNSRRRKSRFSSRIRRVSFTISWLISGCRWSD